MSLDGQLRDGKISRETLAQLVAADSDNSSTSIHWLERRLEILERAVARSGVVVETPDGDVVLRDAGALRAWCRQNFPVVMGGVIAGPAASGQAEPAIGAPPAPAVSATAAWLTTTFIEGREFVFERAGASKLGVCVTLYSAEFRHGSMLISAIEGALPSADFRLDQMLAALGEAADSEPAAWMWCCEPDSLFAHVGRRWECADCYASLEPFVQLGEFAPQNVQGGNVYLLLVPDSHRWALVVRQQWVSLRIELHGPADFTAAVTHRLRLARA